MFNALISASIIQKNGNYIKKIKRRILDDNEKELVEWFIDYEEAHGALPTKERLKKEKNFGVYWTDSHHNEPLSDLYDRTVTALSFNKYSKSFYNIAEEYDENHKFNFYKALGELEGLTPSLGKYDANSILSFNPSLFEDRETNTMPYGIPNLDDVSGGIDIGDYVQLFAPVEVGKTTFLCFFAMRAAMSGYKVLLITKEVTKQKMEEKLASIAGKFNNNDFKRLTQEAKDTLATKAPDVDKVYQKIRANEGEIKIPGEGVFTPPLIKEMAKKEIRETGKGYDIIIFDSFYNISLDGDSIVADDWKSMRTASVKMMEIAKDPDLQTRVIISSQIKPEKKNEISFSYYDIAYCKPMVQDADFIFYLANYEVKSYGMKPYEKGWAVGVMKNRNGPSNGLRSHELLVDFNTSSLYSGETNFINDLSLKELGV